MKNLVGIAVVAALAAWTPQPVQAQSNDDRFTFRMIEEDVCEMRIFRDLDNVADEVRLLTPEDAAFDNCVSRAAPMIASDCDCGGPLGLAALGPLGLLALGTGAAATGAVIVGVLSDSNDGVQERPISR